MQENIEWAPQKVDKNLPNTELFMRVYFSFLNAKRQGYTPQNGEEKLEIIETLFSVFPQIIDHHQRLDAWHTIGISMYHITKNILKQGDENAIIE